MTPQPGNNASCVLYVMYGFFLSFPNVQLVQLKLIKKPLKIKTNAVLVKFCYLAINYCKSPILFVFKIQSAHLQKCLALSACRDEITYFPAVDKDVESTMRVQAPQNAHNGGSQRCAANELYKRVSLLLPFPCTHPQWAQRETTACRH